ncbi:MAG: iron uptake porin [Cyanobacteria bacterium]|nr:iron uptake porin [Cyanobacteriota bacterium]MDW8202008.1 iron uptake porin [Cyanobacteriota bacterium SKYGB_h_bin112]
MKKNSTTLINIASIGVLLSVWSVGESSAIAEPLSISSTATEQATNVSPSMAQVTSVSQLSDVQPTDWAFQALQSLVERYGCIVGYPDGTYRGNRPLSRYEFAAGLNACMDKVVELIAQGTANLATRDDLATLQRLQEEFKTELATLRGRVDALETRTATLEAQQFSTTTKLQGQAIFSVASAYGAAPGNNNAQVVFNNRVRLNLLTSFSGKDLLITGLQSHNFGGGLNSPSLSLAGTLGYGDAVFGATSNVRLAYEPLLGTTDPKTLGTSAGANNTIGLYKLLYIFPVTDRLTAFVGPAAEADDAFPAILPFYGDGQEAVSRFAQMNPVLRVSGGTSGFGLASAAGIIWTISDAFDLRALYGSVNANIPNNAGFPGTPLGAGIFGGSYVAATQLTIKPTSSLDIALNYAHSYHQINITGTGESASAIGAIPTLPVTTPVRLNSFGVTTSYRFSPQFSLSGFFFYSNVNSVSGPNASADFLSYMVGLHVKDALQPGNTFGLLFGQPPTRIGTSNVPLPENARPYHLEAYYKFRVNDNISITPGLFVIFNPEGFSNNPTVYVPVVRSTFSF